MSSKSKKPGPASQTDESSLLGSVTGGAASAMSQLATGSMDFAAGALDNSAVASFLGRGGGDRIDEKVQDKARDQHEKRGEDELAEYDREVDQTVWFREVDEVEAPDIEHDHGFLEGWEDTNGNGLRESHERTGEIDDSRREDPTLRDYASKAKWIAMLEGAEALRPDLVDATATYRHFLFGGGAAYHFEYDRFLLNDSAGQQVEASLTEDVRRGAITGHDERRHAGGDGELDESPVRFTLQNEDSDYDLGAIGVGSDARFPYPGTENWQKAIGGHSIWVEADVQGASFPEANQRLLSVHLVIHMEDMYNFNPGQSDIGSGINDAENGRLSIVGLGHEFLQIGESERHLTFVEPLDLMPGEEDDDAFKQSEGAQDSGRPANARG